MYFLCFQNDTGGQRSLVNKWTTYLKARLVCSVMDDDGTETYFDELEDVFLLEADNPRTTLIYGIFTTSSSVFKGSAVCVYHLSDIQRVFNGPFAHKEGPNHQLIPYQGRIPYPRPGTCPGGAFTPNIRTTKEFPDDVVTFIRNHPLMFNPIYPVHKRPLIVRTGTDYKYTKIAVDRVSAADGRYHVLFLGTDQGTVQKVVVLPNNSTSSGELILEELEVFQNNAPITTMAISSKKRMERLSPLISCILAEVPPLISAPETKSLNFLLNSNSCTSAQTKGSPRFPCTAVISMGPPVLIAALPEILTVPGTAIPALGSTQQGKGKSI
ncbi:hypothetical protein lerEdw1_000682 [Lerista edwardsae]|nr:hypothetical protein lerEdw1_000682 [Lerista edwardsae]